MYVGDPTKRDEYHRIYIYRKSDNLAVFEENFEDRLLDIYDEVCLQLSYSPSPEYVTSEFTEMQSHLSHIRWEKYHEFPHTC